MNSVRVKNTLNIIYESQGHRFVLLAYFLTPRQGEEIRTQVNLDESTPGIIGRWRGTPIYLIDTEVKGMPTGTQIGEIDGVKYSYLELAISD